MLLNMVKKLVSLNNEGDNNEVKRLLASTNIKLKKYTKGRNVKALMDLISLLGDPH